MIGDITALTNPPAAIQFLCKLLVILFKVKYNPKDDGKKIFITCSTKLFKRKNFFKRLRKFKAESIP